MGTPHQQQFQNLPPNTQAAITQTLGQAPVPTAPAAVVVTQTLQVMQTDAQNLTTRANHLLANFATLRWQGGGGNGTGGGSNG